MSELAEMRAAMIRLAGSHPGELIFAWLEALTVATTTNAALVDYQRRRVYRAVIDQLASKGIR